MTKKLFLGGQPLHKFISYPTKINPIIGSVIDLFAAIPFNFTNEPTVTMATPNAPITDDEVTPRIDVVDTIEEMIRDYNERKLARSGGSSPATPTQSIPVCKKCKNFKSEIPDSPGFYTCKRCDGSRQ
jgi:hypothetical protein